MANYSPLLIIFSLVLISYVVQAEDNPFDAAQGLVNQAGNAVGQAKNTTEDAHSTAQNAINAATTTANETQEAANNVASTASDAMNDTQTTVDNTKQTAQDVANATTAVGNAAQDAATASSGSNQARSTVVGLLFGLVIVIRSV